ncbi:MAG TPA: hypothetical protein VJ771_05540 [Candidatus Nitrosotalea sp.]|nr:hypothetical protein [Candidatus Nitrosotalea sp.]
MISKKTKTGKEKATLPVAIAITGGIFMILGGVTVLLMSSWPQPMSGLQFMKDAMMSNIWNFVMPNRSDLVLTTITSVFSLGTGTAVLVGSYKIHTDPKVERRWAFVILVGSIVGLFCASGFGIGGAFLGILGGAATLLSNKGLSR